MYCICCKKYTVSPDQSLKNNISLEEDLLWEKDKNINKSMVQGGIIHIIEAGYGSKHDGDRILLAICDDCINENLEDATLLYFDNYMFNDKEFINKEIDKSKKSYRRRKNLDDLTNK